MILPNEAVARARSTIHPDEIGREICPHTCSKICPESCSQARSKIALVIHARSVQ